MAELSSTTESKIEQVTDELLKCIHQNSVAVRISDTQSSKYLTTAISDAIIEAKAKYKATRAGQNENVALQNNTNSTEEQTRALRAATETNRQLIDALEHGESVTTRVGETLDSAQDAISQTTESIEENNEIIKTASLKIVTAIGTAIKAIAARTIDETAKRLEWVQQLNDAGVKLRGGFDETFTDLSNLSKRSHEEFANLLTSNSNTIARLNTMGLRGEREIANMSQAIVGNYGYTVKTSDSIIKYMLDSRLKYLTEEELHSMNLSSEMDLLAKNLRQSSAAFGKNTEQVIAETKAREDDYTDRMLQAKYGDAYRNMKLSGVPQELIRMFLTNIPNADAMRLLATSSGFQRMYNLMNSNRNSLLNSSTSLQAWNKIMSDKMLSKLINDSKNGNNLQFATLAANSPQVRSLNALSLLQRPDMVSANALSDNETPEINAINSLTDLKTSINKLNNTINNKLSSNLDTIAKGMEILTGTINGTNYMLGLVNPTLAKFVYGTAEAVGGVAMDVMGSMLQVAFLSRAVPYVRRYGYMRGLPLAMRSTGRHVLRGATSVARQTPGLVSRGANWYLHGASKAAKFTRYGGGIISGLGMGLNWYDSYQEGKAGENGVWDTLGGATSGALSGAMAGATLGSIFPVIGTTIGAIGGAIVGGVGSLISRAIGSSNSPAQAGVKSNNYNTSSGSYETQRTVYTDREKETNDKAQLATLKEISSSMKWFVNQNKFNTSPMPFEVGKEAAK